jgi:outer membrane immunogenic protein
MRNWLCTISAAAILASGSAFASDLPTHKAPPPPPPVPVFTWTGFYIGLNAGVAVNSSYNPVFVAGGLFPTSASNLVLGTNSGGTGFTGGAEAGYNWQTGAVVFGLETDINYIDRSGVKNGTYATNPVGYGAAYPTYTLSGFDQDNWFGTVRGRVGYAADRALFFVTGGLA